MLDFFRSLLGSPWVIGLLLVIGVIAFANREGKGADKLRTGIGGFLAGVGGLWAKILFGLPFVGSLALGFANRFGGDRAAGWLDARYARSEDPMLRGTWKDRWTLANQRIPKDKFPSAWRKGIAEDLKRSLTSDGRLITGDSMAKIAEASITRGHLDLAGRAAGAAFVAWFSLMLLVWHPGFIGSMGSTNSLSAGSADVAAVANDDRLIGRTLSKDYWDEGAYRQAIATRKNELVAPRGGGLSIEEIGLDLLSSIAMAFAVGLLMALSTFRASIRQALAVVGSKIHDGTKEQQVRWHLRHPTREIEYDGYCEQLALSDWDQSPLLDLGVSSGTFRFRGSLGAPYKGQRMKISLIDTKKNMLIFGGTGSGKSRTVLLPLMQQLLRIRSIQMEFAIEMRKRLLGPAFEKALRAKEPGVSAAEVNMAVDRMAMTIPKNRSASASAGEFQWPWGITPDFDTYSEIVYPLIISTYVTDAKAVLYDEFKDMAEKMGVLSDLLVLGPNERAGEFSVDLLDTIEPQLVADILGSIQRQAGADGAKDIWPDLATECIRNCAVLARMFDRLPAAAEWIRTHRGERPWSLVFIFDLAMDEEGALLEMVLEKINEAVNDPDLFPYIKAIYNIEFEQALKYLTGYWLKLVPETKDGIRTNITKILGGFSNNPILRQTFAGGAGVNQVSVDQLWGRLCVTNLSNDDKRFGSAGRVINIFLKTLFMIEATNRQRDNVADLRDVKDRFFRLFPGMSRTAALIETINIAIDSNPSLYTQRQITDFRNFKDAATACNDALSEALDSAHINSPDSPEGIAANINAKTIALQEAGLFSSEIGRASAAARHQYLKAKEAFEEFHPTLAINLVKLGDRGAVNPHHIAERIRSQVHEKDGPGEDDVVREFRDQWELLEGPGSKCPVNTIQGIIRHAHELYHRWHVLKTKLGGSGKGAFRESMFMIIDEVQSLMTVDSQSAAPSEHDFPNKSRSTNVSIVAATQTPEAIELQVGKAAAANYIKQMRSMIILSNESEEATRLIKSNAGKALRSYVYEAGAFESYDAMLMMNSDMTDIGLDGIQDIEVNNDDPSNPELLSAGVRLAMSPSEAISANDALRSHDKSKIKDRAYIPKRRKLRTRNGGVDDNADDILAREQQAAWRSQDLHHKSMSEGNQEMEVFNNEDVGVLGANHAYMIIQRAGKSRQDIVKLDDPDNRTIEIM